MRWARYIHLKFRRKILRPLKHWDRRLEEFGTDLLYDRRHNFATVTIGSFLRGASWVFRGIVKTRATLYEQRILKSQYLGCVVIAVGNVTVGGTGKTPVVEKLARELQSRGRKVAILSRGYRSKPESKWHAIYRLLTHAEEKPPRIVSNGEKVLLNSEVAGDEPFMLASNLPGVIVLTDKNRVKAGRYAIKEMGCDTLILDDGYQYLKLRSQINLLLIDQQNPFGNGCLLPRGILREPISGIRKAHAILFTKSTGTVPPDLLKTVQHYKRKDAEIIITRHAPQYLRSIDYRDRLELSALAGKRVAIFCGIAAPKSFENFIEKLGAIIVYKRHFPDHYRFSEEDIANVFKSANALQAEYVITTEKDAVRVSPNWLYPLPFYFLRIEVQILKGGRAFEHLLQRIEQPFSRITKSENL